MKLISSSFHLHSVSRFFSNFFYGFPVLALVVVVVVVVVHKKIKLEKINNEGMNSIELG